MNNWTHGCCRRESDPKAQVVLTFRPRNGWVSLTVGIGLPAPKRSKADGGAPPLRGGLLQPVK
jgi:hypothetical protein